MQVIDYQNYVKNGRLDLPADLVDFPSALFIGDDEAIVSLGNLRSVRGGLHIRDCVNLVDLGDLTTVHGPVNCVNCPSLRDASHLTSARGVINLMDTRVTFLPENITVKPQLPATKPFVALSTICRP